MLPKPPTPSDGPSALYAYREALELHETTLRNRFNREFYRKELRAKAKYYGTLAGKRPEGGEARAFYEALSEFLARQFEAYGPEAPVKRRRKADAPTAPLAYADLPEELTYRVHFLERGSLKRERSATLAGHADAVSRQTAPNGDVLLSLAVSPARVQFFERLIESIGADGLGVPWPGKAGGFAGWIRPDGSLSRDRDFDETRSPWAKMMADIYQARLYHWSLDRGQQLSPNIVLPKDRPPIPESLPCDPDPRFQAILDLTSEERLAEAAEHLDAIPGAEREPLFDEVLYLRFLTGAAPRGEDLRYLARRHVVGSAIRPRLDEEFESFIAELDRELTDAGPLTDEFPGFEDRSWLWENEPSAFTRNTPRITDWPATRKHYFEALALYGHPTNPRGRIFIWHPDLGSLSMSQLYDAFAPQMVAAENAFRRTRGIPETGRGWVLEVALYDLVRARCPDAVHQWRPPFLGLQSVDIYVPSERLAIEYQGQQHFDAVELFGGEEGLAATQARDSRKRALLAAEGVRLIEWRYDLPVTAENIDKVLLDSTPGSTGQCTG